jgi:hypothetical protein
MTAACTKPRRMRTAKPFMVKRMFTVEAEACLRVLLPHLLSMGKHRFGAWWLTIVLSHTAASLIGCCYSVMSSPLGASMLMMDRDAA